MTYQETAPPAPPLRDVSVLVVDDSAASRLVCGAMARALGARVETAETAAQALALAERCGFDLIIVDIGLPDADGRVLINAVRAAPACTRTAILCISGLDGEPRRKSALIAGADAFATKPFFDISAFQAAIGAAMGWVVTDAQAGVTAAPDLSGVQPEALRDLNLAADRLRAAVASGDAGALRRGAHFLSGVAAIMGDDQLAGLCRKSEAASDDDAGALRATEKMLTRTEAARRALIEQGGL